MVDFVNLLLCPADSMACLFADHDQAAGRNTLHLGCEALGLTWQDCDLVKGVCILRQTKGGEAGKCL